MSNLLSSVQLFVEMVSKRKLTRHESSFLEHLLSSTADPTELKTPDEIVTPVPLTQEDLLQGGWYCRDVSQNTADAFSNLGLTVRNVDAWYSDGPFHTCVLFGGRVSRTKRRLWDSREISRKGNHFYWAE